MPGPDMADVSGVTWDDAAELTAWKKQRRQNILLAMGWRRWAAVACMLLGGVIRLRAHGFTLQLLGMGLGMAGVAFIWVGRKRYVDSLPAAGS